MKIGVIQASTRTDLNQLLFEAVKQAAGNCQFWSLSARN